MTTPIHNSPSTIHHSPLSPSLHALIIRLLPTQDGHLPATTSDLAHAAFLRLLEQADPNLAEQIHNGRGKNPFTLSPLHGYERTSKSQLQINLGQEGWLRLTLLDTHIFHTFINHFLHNPGRHTTIRLNQIPFQVTEILNHPASHPLAGYTTLSQLAQENNQADTLQLHFTTPTAFSLRRDPYRRQILFPDPVTVFGKLAHSWDKLTGEETHTAVTQYTTHCALVKAYQLQSQMLIIKKQPQIGFTGHATYQFKDQTNHPMLAHLHRLAHLAFYTGLGNRTSMGMGQVQVKDEGGSTNDE